MSLAPALAAAAHASTSRLEALNLQKSYGSRRVVKDVSLAVEKGEVVGLLGPNVADEMTGSLITYDNTSDVFTVDGGPGSPSATPGGPSGRIRAVLSPRATASAPAAPPAAPAQLRQSTTIGGERK